MNQYNFKSVKRISKKEARKRYDAGENVLFIPCLLNPENNFYCLGIWENKDLCGQYESFDKLVNEYEFYNCRRDTGLYTAFYVKAL